MVRIVTARATRLSPQRRLYAMKRPQLTNAYMWNDECSALR